MRFDIKTKRGFTLIEVIITMVIVGIFLAGVFSFFQYNLNVFNLGVDQSNVQANIRSASLALTDEMRYAAEVKLLIQSELDLLLPNVATDALEPYVNYAYYDSGYICIVNRNNQQKYYVGDGGTDRLTFALSDDEEVLSFNIKGIEESRSYSYDAEAKILNQKFRDPSTITTPSNGIAIKYWTPADFMAIDTRPVVIGMPVPGTESVQVNFAVDMHDAVLVSDNMAQSPAVTIAMPSVRMVELSSIKSLAINRRIVFDVSDTTNNTYTYALTYNGTAWYIE